MKYVGECPNCHSNMTVEFVVKPTRMRGSNAHDAVFEGAKPFIMKALEERPRLAGEIGEYVKANFSNWPWKQTLVHPIITQLEKEGKIERSPVLKNGHYISLYHLPGQAPQWAIIKGGPK